MNPLKLQPQALGAAGSWAAELRRLAAAFIGFSRPHTIIATSLQVLTIYVMVKGGFTGDLPALAVLVVTLISCLAANIYVVGLNQITDIEIDRINKPGLPLASGQLSLTAGRRITAIAALLSLALAALSSLYLLLTVGAVMLIGAIYSLPPMRLKRFPLWAALSIAAARGFLANVGVGLHYHALFGGPLPITTLIMLGVFFFGFGLVIAIYKDMPDLIGDRMHQIQTFTTRLGQQGALRLGQVILSTCYLLPIAVAIAGLPAGEAIFLLATHLLVITLFWLVSTRVDLSRQRSITLFYRFLWLLFYTEFVVLCVYELMRRAG